jgi:hypothetical protein
MVIHMPCPLLQILAEVGRARGPDLVTATHIAEDLETADLIAVIVAGRVRDRIIVVKV